MKRYILHIFLLTATLGLGGCRAAGQEDMKDVFRYNEAGGILSLDPAFARIQSHVWAVRQVFSGLIRLDSNLDIVPEVAKKWEVSNDGLNYTFILRDDVFFHKSEAFLPQYPDSTRRVTAADFRYSLARLTDEKVAAPGAWTMGKVQDTEAVDDTTLVIRLKENFPPFLGILTMGYCSVVPWEAVEYYGNDFRTRPVGTGPFYVKYWKENEKLVLRSNPLFFERDGEGRRLPYLEAINVTFLPDKVMAFMEFLTGKSDFVSGLDAGYADQVLNAEGSLREEFRGKMTLKTQPYLNTEYLGIRQDLPDAHPLSDRRIRQALCIGFDRHKMMLYLRKSIGMPAYGGIIPDGFGCGSGNTENPYDPQKAAQLLADYKQEKGEITPFVLQTNSGYQDLCEYIQGQWQALGIPVSVEVVPLSTLRQSMATGKTDFFRASWVADYPDAENYVSLFYSPNRAPSGPNYTHYKNEEYDRLYEKAVVCLGQQQREGMYRSLDSIAMQDYPVIPLYYDRVVRFVSPWVEHFEGNALNLLDLRAVSKRR